MVSQTRLQDNILVNVNMFHPNPTRDWYLSLPKRLSKCPKFPTCIISSNKKTSFEIHIVAAAKRCKRKYLISLNVSSFNIQEFYPAKSILRSTKYISTIYLTPPHTLNTQNYGLKQALC